MARLVSKVYGEALFDLALEKQSVDTLYDEAASVRQVFRQNNDLMLLLTRKSAEKNGLTPWAMFSAAGFLTIWQVSFRW